MKLGIVEKSPVSCNLIYLHKYPQSYIKHRVDEICN